MKRRIMFTMAVAVFAALAVASVAQAASVPQAGTVSRADGDARRHAGGAHLLVELKVQEPDERAHHRAAPRGPGRKRQPADRYPDPWISDGSRTLGLRYGNGGYWPGTVNFVFTITPPVMPGDTIICRWIASYGTGSDKVTGPNVDIQAGVGVP